MQLCQKETLKDWLGANTLSRDRVKLLHIFQQILGAVEYVHTCGMIHRDLKVSLEVKTVIVKRGVVIARCSYGDGTLIFDPSMCV